MKRKSAFPFQVLPGESVRVGSWMLGDRGEPLERAGDILENWDYARDLEVRLDLEVDLELASASLGIEIDELKLDVVLKAGTGSGKIPRRVDVLARRAVEKVSPKTTLIGLIESGNLSGRLSLECGVLLGEVSSIAGALTPRWKGARLWETKREVLIEDGGASRFPIETVSFTENFRGAPHEHAPWYVDWKPDRWHLDFGGAVRLYVNSDIREVEERVTAGDPLTLQAILGDTINQIISSVLAAPDGEELLDDCGEGSLGNQVSHWIETAFPGQSMKSIASLRSHRPGRFHAAVLGAADATQQYE